MDRFLSAVDGGVRLTGWKVDLPLTASAWQGIASEPDADNSEIEDALEQDLAGPASDLVQDSCESGGWPDGEYVVITECTVSPTRLIAKVSVYFTELIASACQNLPHSESRGCRLLVTLDSGSSIGFMDYAASDLSRMDLGDRNSAADGT